MDNVIKIIEILEKFDDFITSSDISELKKNIVLKISVSIFSKKYYIEMSTKGLNPKEKKRLMNSVYKFYLCSGIFHSYNYDASSSDHLYRFNMLLS
jgi:hypothetical protein